MSGPTTWNRFWAKVSPSTPATGCWEWTAHCFPTGYGQFWHNGNTSLAHRTAYALTRGPIPEGMHVLHTCDNRRCVNPWHLELGTNADNIADKVAKGRQLRGTRIPWARLTEADVRSMRALYPAHTYQELSDLFGVSISTVGHVINRRTWAHVR